MEASITSQVATTDFLTLLTVQLKNQDPIDPTKQEDFIGQLAQFSTLEGIENLNTSFEDMLRLQEISQGMSLVGKEVEYLNPQTNELQGGEISEFFVDGGQVKLMVNGNALTLDLIASVKS